MGSLNSLIVSITGVVITLWFIVVLTLYLNWLAETVDLWLANREWKKNNF